MSGFHFSKVPKFKIRRGGIVEDAPHPPLTSFRAPGSGPTGLQDLETTAGHPSVSPAPGVRVGVPDSASRGSPAGNIRSSAGKRPKVESGEQAREYINIGARQDELDPSVVDRLLPAVALAATSVHKYWTSPFEKAVDTAEVTELMKLAEMYTSRSHVLNCELYKMLEMRVVEIQSALGEDENAEAMRAEVKRLRARLAFSEDARSRATYDIAKAQTIQKACVVAQKKAESQLKSCQNMIQAKDRELIEVSNELAKAKALLAKLGVPGYTGT
ncbi:hypothetical protein Fot_36031 [Forsythia ovata]|uniref:Uncharacterized protein n=1 Tax=Forsythia ovata TaxID=205694 RepID=A0ABD1SPD2_9LAMI